MNYVMLALAGILSGGIVFGAKILFMSGATLFEVMLFPNLIGAALFTPFVVKEFKRFIGVPPVITLLFTLSVLLVNVGDYVPLFMNVSVTLVLLLVYLQPIWTIMIERFYFKKTYCSGRLGYGCGYVCRSDYSHQSVSGHTLFACGYEFGLVRRIGRVGLDIDNQIFFKKRNISGFDILVYLFLCRRAAGGVVFAG